MFKLYINNGRPTMIDIASTEYEIIETIGEYIKEYPYAIFSIVRSYEDGDEPFKIIKSLKDYNEYYEELDLRRIKEMSCVELKDDIIKRMSLRRR